MPLQRTSPVSEGVLFQSGLPAVGSPQRSVETSRIQRGGSRRSGPPVMDGTGKLAGLVAESRAEEPIPSIHPRMTLVLLSG
jgi:hypothetical protein